MTAHIRLNTRGATVAAGLIRAGRIERITPWEFSQVDSDALVTGRRPDGMFDIERFSAFHLGRRMAQNGTTRQAWVYPFGKLVNGRAFVFREALELIKGQAERAGLRGIMNAATSLINRIDGNDRVATKLGAGVFAKVFQADPMDQPVDLSWLDSAE